MYKVDTLKNGLTLITIPIPALESVTTLLAVPAGSRFEDKRTNGISHFLEHMFFKGSTKYPSAEEISNLIDGMGAVNNAATSKEYTYYWVKSSAKYLEKSTDILSSMIKDPILSQEEIDKEKGVIIEELRMFKDDPRRYVWDLYEGLQFGDQPLGWDIGGDEKTINSFKREDFLEYVESLYGVKQMALVYAGKIPENIKEIAEQYFADLPKRKHFKPKGIMRSKQLKPKVANYFKETDQANMVLGVEGYDRNSEKRYAAKILGTILGEGMSSRLFTEVREKRGLAYSIAAGNDSFVDTGTFVIFAGLKLEKVYEGLQVIVTELTRITKEKVTDEELIKAKEMTRGRLSLRSESTNFLAEYFGIDFILDRKLVPFEDELKRIDKVTKEDVLEVAKELFQPKNYNLQLIGPFKVLTKFESILRG